MSAASRRGLLGGLAALAPLAAGAAVLPFAEPDAELLAIGKEAISLVEQYSRLAAEWFALSPKDRPGIQRVVNALDPIDARLEELWGRARELPALTLAGFRSKAILLRYQFDQYHRTDAGLIFNHTCEDAAFDLFGELIGTAA